MSAAATGDDQGLRLLAGVRVVDLTQALSGPFATLMLADLSRTSSRWSRQGEATTHVTGARRSSGTTRRTSGRSTASSAASHSTSRPRRLASARRLVASADVVVENWRPGTAERLGLGRERLCAGNPGLVVCSISGYGQDGDARAGSSRHCWSGRRPAGGGISTSRCGTAGWPC